jgi:alkylhydroperoxidase family enzyme
VSRIIPDEGRTGHVIGRARSLVQVLPYVLLAGILFAVWCPSATQPSPSLPTDVEQARPMSVLPLADSGVLGQVRSEMTFPALSDATAWACLPSRIRGEATPLPIWARTLAQSLPRTTAAMLELDFAHRAGSPLDPKLRGLIRWESARALQSNYGVAYALADLRATQMSEDEIQVLTADPDTLPDETRRILAFVRRLSTAAVSVTDEEVAHLVSRHGEKQVVAIVFCVAYCNFLDRLLLALGLSVEPGGPLPPMDVRFAKRWLAVNPAPPVRAGLPLEASASPPDACGLRDPDWNATDLTGIRCNVAARKARQSRIALPATDPTANRWGLVGQTYQPALAVAWSACTQAFAEEADQDPVFEQSLFWVVTRTKQCFYCMGHTEMMFVVSGLDGEAMNARIRLLAGGDWSSLRPAERTALQFAHKHAKDPAAIEPREVRALVRSCGTDRALDVIWWSCRCHYMMCVADAFLLPLEAINVFDGFDPNIMRLRGPDR